MFAKDLLMFKVKYFDSENRAHLKISVKIQNSETEFLLNLRSPAFPV